MTREEQGQSTEAKEDLTLVELAKVDEVELPKGLNSGEYSAVREAVPEAASEPAPDATSAEAANLRRVETPWAWSMLQRGAALLAILLLSPLFVFAFLAIKLTSRGPFLFKQKRRGHGGEPFTILKMRTMTVGSEKATALGVNRQSSHVTAVGRIFRRLKIDELTQLWNIARGDMELVGPRPIPIALEDKLREEIPHFHERNRVKPGLTSFSQVVVVDNGLDEQLVKDWTERFQAELHYIRSKSVGYDIIVIGMSALYVLRMVFGMFRRGKSKRQAKTSTSLAPATDVLGTPICNLDYDEVVNYIGRWVHHKESHYICIAPVHSVVEGYLHQSHRESLSGASLNTADGQPIVWAQKMLGHRHATRVYGPTLMLKTMQKAERLGWKVAFYGGHPDRLVTLVDRMKLQFPKLEIVAAISPPYRKLSAEEDAEFIQQLRDSEADVIFVGLGCPKQERWMHDHSAQLPATMLGVGAAFDFHAQTLAVAPPFLQKIGMEWFFRLCCEPKRLFKRYATTNPIYVGLLFCQVLKRFLLFRSYQLAPKATSSEPSNEATETAPDITGPQGAGEAPAQPAGTGDEARVERSDDTANAR